MDSVLFSDADLIKKIKDFIQKGAKDARFRAGHDPFWQSLRNTGTELWLDSGDIDEIKEIWSAEMTALTTNNTLLNKEIQKGIYDSVIRDAAEIVGKLPLQEQVIAIAFILNARHGLRLAEIFGGFVSVELHTDTANDFDAIIRFGKLYADMSPDRFLVKVPYTATGLLGARKLRDMGVKVNLTLEFSARQNVLVSAISQPNYCNVFLGRLGSYLKDNNLGDAGGVGEKAVLSSLGYVHELTKKNKTPTKLIAASLRDAEQLENLAGVDVFTMPVKVALEGKAKLSGKFVSGLDKEFAVNLNDSGKGIFVEKLWEVSPDELSLARDLGNRIPKDSNELINRANKAGCIDLFPDFSDEDNRLIYEDGKIPKHEKWAERIKKGELAIDTLLNAAGLASFAKDQEQLDDRIRSLIGEQE